MNNSIVKSIKFDFFYNGKEYTNLDSGYGVEDGIDIDYLHDYDGPWFLLELGDDIFDFQIFGDEETGKLKIDAYKCTLGNDGYVAEKEWLVNSLIDNIRVEYVN